MRLDRIEAISALLVQAEKAHGAHEATELKGVYDQDWARWYAGYAVENGIGATLGHPVAVDELAGFLAGSYLDFQQAHGTATDPWSAYAARRIAAEL